MSATALTEALFKLPYRSNFRMPFHKQGNCTFGKIYALKSIEMNPNDSIKVNMQSLTRSNALKYATMANIRCEYHAFFVPARILAHNYDNAFNLAIDAADRPALPVMNGDAYGELVLDGLSPREVRGSLLDTLDYPTFSELYNEIIGNSAFQADFDKSPGNNQAPSIVIASVDLSNYFGDPATTDVLTNLPTFNAFLMSNAVYSAAISSLRFTSQVPSPVSVSGNTYFPLPGSAVAALISPLVGKSTSVLFEEYIDSIFSKVWNDILSGKSDLLTRFEDVNFLSIWSYWRVIYDWYINTNIDQNIETWEKWCFNNFGMTIDTWNPAIFFGSGGLDLFRRFITPAERLFASDYFTSAFNSTQNGAAVPIPAGGTLIDLRSAESEQTFREKLLYSGKRVIDQNRTIYGARSSDGRFDRAEILGSQKFLININSVSQTSQTTDVDNSLGVLAGQGYGAGSRKGFVRHYAEERGLVLILMSYKPETIYSGVVDRQNLKTSVFDYLIPDFENVGEQGIKAQELAYIPYSNAVGDVFGFNRRFAEYMFIQSGVYGSFRTSLSFMTLSRSFKGKPALNPDFIRIKSAVSRYDDIFVASEDDENFFNWSFFEVYCSRPLSRYIEYGF